MPSLFSVAGIIVKKGPPDNILLVHSVYPASSRDEAIGVAVADVPIRYPGYMVATMDAILVDQTTEKTGS